MRRRHTKSHTQNRRSHHALKLLVLAVCAKCGQPVLPHKACPNCGTFKGKEVIDVLKKLDKRDRKKREKELAAQEKETQKDMSMESLSAK